MPRIKPSPGRERTSNSLERKHPSRPPRDMILIVCSVESKDYFQDMVNHLKLNNRITVETTSSNDPIQQVEEALEISHQADPHRRLFALLDQGDPDTESGRPDQIRQAQDLARYHDLPNNRIFRLILTAPGFPLWLLLHFDEAEFSALPPQEWPQKVANKLGEFIPRSSRVETRREFFKKTHKHLELAIKRGQKQVLIRKVKPGPRTEIHELITYLLKLQERYARLRACP